MAQWFLSYNGQQVGPLDDAAAIAQARGNPNGFAWREGFSAWKPIGEVVELSGGSGMSVVPASMPPPPSGAQRSDEVDYRIVGNDMQFVEIELDPGESVVAEAGAMMYKDAAVVLQTVFGDSSYATQNGTFMDKLLSAGKRVITGEGLFTTLFRSRHHARARRGLELGDFADRLPRGEPIAPRETVRIVARLRDRCEIGRAHV